ncbi:hypothetical protein CRYUN_Cryun37aG0089000 [Craigia yunnanensis]
MQLPRVKILLILLVKLSEVFFVFLGTLLVSTDLSLMESPIDAEVNFGKSIIVVQELAKEHITKIPPRYVRPDQEPSSVLADHDQLPSVPIIDLQKLLARTGDSSRRKIVCKRTNCWGQERSCLGTRGGVNHSVSMPLLVELKLEIENFFKLPHEEKKLLWQQPDNHEGSANCLETLEVYSMEVKNLAMIILGYMASALKMDAEEMRELFSDGVQSMRMNYYPPCPEPDMPIGFSPHSDAGALTILFQLNETEGLQIQKDGKWVSIKPLPNAFVVNIVDIMEIVSNGIYRSIEHRAIVNSTKERLSIATFYFSLGN